MQQKNVVLLPERPLILPLNFGKNGPAGDEIMKIFLLQVID